MTGAFRQSMGWLHAWAGLVVGWVLFFVFLTGTAGYFNVEIDQWMQPERPLPQAAASMDEVIALAQERLATTVPNAKQWSLGFPGYRSSDLRIFWRNPLTTEGGDGATGRAEFNPATGEPITYRETGGGRLLYRMHYWLHYFPTNVGIWIVGICTMFMLLAIVTGVIIHKRIFKDFFTFRARKGPRSWLDAHNVLSVLALPFHLMITYSGLVFFAYTYMAPVVAASYGFGVERRDTYFDELFDRNEIPKRAGISAPLVPLGLLIEKVEDRLGAGEVQVINIYNPGDANARIGIYADPSAPSHARTELMFDGTTGELLRSSGPRSAPMATYQTLLALHEGLFAGPVVRWLYFLSGLTGTAMIGAGLVLWTAKRRAKIGSSFGFRLVERLNIGTIVGLPVAITAYFWANRLIPVEIEGRAAWEAHAMFIVWAVMLLHAFVRRGERAWVEQLWIAAAAFGLLPLLNALTTDRHLGVTLPAGAWELAGFDLTVLAFGIAFAIAAWWVGRRRRFDARNHESAWAPSPRSKAAE